jgi:hypothetical protein
MFLKIRADIAELGVNLRQSDIDAHGRSSHLYQWLHHIQIRR